VPSFACPSATIKWPWRLLLIDLDPQGQLAEGFGLNAGELQHEIAEVLDRKLHLADSLIPLGEMPDLALAPSNIKLS
jgi:cellulose biosynthesis protein BcsQ